MTTWETPDPDKIDTKAYYLVWRECSGRPVNIKDGFSLREELLTSPNLQWYGPELVSKITPPITGDERARAVEQARRRARLGSND